MSDLKFINGHWYDFGCSNSSFILTAKELKTVGIKNYYFMLRIDNPRVADIDPFKPNITDQEVKALMAEYRTNMWSFMRTAVRLRTDKGIVPYTLHRGLAAMAWCFEHHFDNCLCEPRQTYKTTETIAGPIQWAFQLSRNLHMHFYGKETDNTKRNLNHLKSDIELLPEWLQFRRYIDSEGKVKKARASTEILMNNLLNNDLCIYPKPASKTHAQSIGRGGSGAIVYYDEMEHTPFFGEILSNSAPLFKTASENAAAVGSPHCRLFSCTPGDLDTVVGRENYPIVKSMIPWTEKIYDMTPQEIEDYKSAYKDEYNNSDEDHTRNVIDVFYIEYQYYQLRKTYAWVQEQYKLSGDKMAIRREILLQRLRGSNQSPLDPEDVEYLISNMKKSDKDLIINGKWRFLLYDHGQGLIYGKPKDLDENIPYLVGIDPAAGGGGDNFAITIINPYNLQIAAEFKSPYISGVAACNLLITLVNDYIPKAVLIPERNSMGIYLIQMIVEQTSIKENLYWSKDDKQLEDIVSESPLDAELLKLSQIYKKYGTYLTKKVRDAMFELLFKHVAECKQLLNTEYLVDDICKLIRTSTGKIEAVKGEHDDCLMSYLHAIYIYYTGDNMEAFGIDKTLYPAITTPVEMDLSLKLEEKDPYSKFFSTENIRTYEDYAMEDAAKHEEEAKELVNRFNFIHDDVYSNSNNSSNENDTSISPYFFDTVNDVW